MKTIYVRNNKVAKEGLKILFTKLTHHVHVHLFFSGCCNGGQIVGIIFGVLFGCAVIIAVAFFGMKYYNGGRPSTNSGLSFSNPLSRQDSVRQPPNSSTVESAGSVHYNAKENNLYEDNMTIRQPSGTKNDKIPFAYDNDTYDA